MTERRLSLAWSRSWEDSAHDFSARDGDILVGRVYRILGGPAGGKWRWSMFAMIANRQGTGGGVADGRDEACQAVEDSYRALRESIDG